MSFIPPLTMALLAALASAAVEPFIPADAGGPVTILSPLPDSAVAAGEPLEISLLLDGLDGLEHRLFLDGDDVTARAEITGEYVFWLSGEAAAGPYQAMFLALDGGDTVHAERWTFTVAEPDTQRLAEPHPAGGLPPLPLEVSVTAGAQYGRCGQDTAGLGLTYPVGAWPAAEFSVSGPLAGGMLSAYAGYDPSYDRAPHGLAQWSAAGFDLVLGEFYPDISELAFSGVTPLGGLLELRRAGLEIALTACRTQAADTGLQSFAQFLYGGQARAALWDSLRLSAGWLGGFDDPSSLPDSVRWKRSVFVYTDTLFGLADSIVSVDSLHPGRNRILWLGAEYAPSRLSLRAEAARSVLLPDSGGAAAGLAFTLSSRFRLGAHRIELGYSSLGDRYQSFGNPYAEPSRNELWLRHQSELGGGLSAELEGAAYEVAADSADGISRRVGAAIGFAGGALRSSSVRIDYQARPYAAYLTQSRSVSLAASVAAGPCRISPSYAYTSSSSDRLTQSHTAAVEIAFPPGRPLGVRLGVQYYQLRDNAGSADQDRMAPYFKCSWRVDPSSTVDFWARHIAKSDRIDPARSYRQSVLALQATRRF